MEIILLVILGIIAIAEIVAAIYAIKSHIYAEQINILSKQLQTERNTWIEREGIYVKEIVVLREWVKKYLSDEEKNTFQAMFNENYDECVNKKIIK